MSRRNHSRTVLWPLLLLQSGCWPDDCGAELPWRPIGPLSGKPCETQDVCETKNITDDPWVYECVGGVYRVTMETSTETLRCGVDSSGRPTGFGRAADAQPGVCTSVEEDFSGPSTGIPCNDDGATTCSKDVDSDPWFYVCYDGSLEVFDHEKFRGNALCHVLGDGTIAVTYGGEASL